MFTTENSIISIINAELTSPSASERKQCHNLIYKLVEISWGPCLSIMSADVWRMLIQSCLILEENQQHIIKAHLAEFLTLVEGGHCPSEWSLTLYRRAFNHENKKVTRLFCFLALSRLHDLDPDRSDELTFVSKALIPLTSNMFLYDAFTPKADSESDPISPRMVELLHLFASKNTKILPTLLIALSQRGQSAPPVFYWLVAIEAHWTGDENRSATLVGQLHMAIREIATRILKTHPGQVRSASQSLLCSILVKLETNSNVPNGMLYQTLAKMDMLNPCRTRNVWAQLDRRCSDVAITNPENWSENKTFHSTLNQSEIRGIVLKMILHPSNWPFPARFIQSIFDSRLTPDGMPRLINAIRLTAEYIQYAQYCRPDGNATSMLDQPFSISFFELIFNLFNHWTTAGVSFEQDGCVVELGTISKCLYPLLSQQMQRLTNQKLIELIISTLRDTTSSHNPTFVAFSLSLGHVLLSELVAGRTNSETNGHLTLAELITKYQAGSLACSFVIEAAWNCRVALEELNVKSSTDLMAVSVDAMEKCGISGQISILKSSRIMIERELNVETVAELIKSAWRAVEGAFHCRLAHKLYHYFATLLVNPVTIRSEELKNEIVSVFHRVQERSRTRHGMLLPLITRYFDSCTDPMEIPEILHAALLAGTGYNRDITCDIDAKNFALTLVAAGRIDVEDEDQFTVDVMGEMDQVRIRAITACSSLSEEGTIGLIDMLMKTHDRESEKRSRYHGESATHKLKERVWQTITHLLAAGKISDQSQRQKYFNRFLSALNMDDQSSVTMLQEAAIVSCILKDESLWSVCHGIIDDDAQTEFIGSVSALLVIGLLYGVAKKDGSFFVTYIGHCLRLQQSNNFLVRIHAIACIKASYEWSITAVDHCDIADSILAAYPFLARHVAFAQHNAAAGNMGRNVDRIMNNIYFQKFDFTKDLSFCALYRYIPLHSGGRKTGLLPLRVLQQVAEPGIPFVGEFDTELEGEETPDETDELDLENHCSTMQQKITPWMNEKEDKAQSSGKLKQTWWIGV